MTVTPTPIKYEVLISNVTALFGAVIRLRRDHENGAHMMPLVPLIRKGTGAAQMAQWIKGGIDKPDNISP